MSKIRKKVVPFTVEGTPVNVHAGPTSFSPVINAIEPNTEILVVGEEKGYLKLLHGGYVMKSSHTILNEKKIKENYGKKVLEGKIKDFKVKKSLAVTGTDPFSGANIRILKGVTTDNNGNTIPDNEKGPSKIYSVSKVNYETRTVVLNDPSGSVTRTVSFDEIEVGDPKDVPVQYNPTPGAPESEHKDIQYKTVDAYFEEKNTSVADIDNYNTWMRWGSKQAQSSLIDEVKNFLQPETFDMKNTRNVFGSPYQFTPIADTRIDDSMELSAFGRKYNQKIVSRAPILVMQAGTPYFLKGFNDEQKKSMVESLKDVSKGDIDDIINSEGKYYSFKDASIDYYRGVNEMCRAMAAMLGLNKRKITVNGYDTPVELSEIDWRQTSTKPKWGYYRGAVGFYVNSEAQMQDAISNGTRQSQLAGQVNQISDQAAEMQFILGGVASLGVPGVSDLANLGKEKTGQDAAAKAANEKSSASNTGVIGSLMNNINTLMSGGKLIFPEIWSDSSFTKNYNITIKLDSPDCDTFSIYMNILVPLAHILAFCMPRYAGSNAYVSPFIVRAYLRSMFHVDMGIITNCDILKGDNQAWNQDGLPNQVTVQMTIKDLYSVMAMFMSKNTTNDFLGDDLIANPAQLDYLGNLCGINVAVPDFGRTLALWYAIRNPITGVTDALGRVFTALAGLVNNRWQSLFNSHFSM